MLAINFYPFSDHLEAVGRPTGHPEDECSTNNLLGCILVIFLFKTKVARHLCPFYITVLQKLGHYLWQNFRFFFVLRG